MKEGQNGKASNVICIDVHIYGVRILLKRVVYRHLFFLHFKHFNLTSCWETSLLTFSDDNDLFFWIVKIAFHTAMW